MTTALVRAIDRLEDCLARGELREAAALVGKLLQRLELRQNQFGAGSGDAAAVEAEATRLAAAVSRLLGSPEYRPATREWRSFVLFKRVIAQVFEVSGYRGTAHLRGQITRRARSERRRPTTPESARLFMGLSINAADDAALALLRWLPPPERLVTVLAFLSEYLTWAPEAEQARTNLLRSQWSLENAKLSPNEWTLLASAWMACSYADAPNRHDIKKYLNSLVRDWLESRGVEIDGAASPAVSGPGPAGTRALQDADGGTPSPASTNPGDETGQGPRGRGPSTDPDGETASTRPTLLIIAEIYYKGHAMDRCYRPSIRALRKHFRTVLMLGADPGDRLDESLFDEVDRTPFDARYPERFLQRARSYGPAIVYLPSVGMRIAGIASANVRLAPIQMATLGHPATTHCPAVDYIVMADQVFGDPGVFSETVLLRRSAANYVGVTDTPAVRPDIRRGASPVRLAVPAWIRKVTPRFLDTCSRIARQASRPVEFHFFPNVRGVLFQAARRRLEDALPARVYPSTSYAEYLANINACDIHLSTFPFGSSNGIVDSACQGLPVVNLLGIEPHSRIDAMLVGRLAQPDWLTVSTIEGYVDAAVRLVDDDALRVEISEAILGSEPAAQFLLPDDAATGDFAEICLAVYRHDARIRESGRKVWSYEELTGLDAQ